MTAPVIGVLALQGDVREHVAALAGAGADARPVRRPAELDAVDGLVIPGGESTTISKLADIFEMREPIDKRIAGGMPVYGSCAGMIMLAAEVLDGRPDQRGFAGIEMTVRRNAFGRQVDSFEAPVEIAGVEGEPFHAIFIRAPWVERVGAGVEVLGRVTDDGSSSLRGVRRAELESSLGPAGGRIVAVRQGHLMATSFHPELTGDLRLHRYFVDLVRAAA
ncbi:pyridoxal 5'-phosphate synthase glutaminase subunit PdxT [Micromonospora sp. AP08]|uniref:pyridoxal 5'-phosphate synthase glutaminase subunit PdxT n=1 Tax=Micromonospora sp. AP08 TaxID=2604467 RepID=UPI0011D939C5|nr:pyridoxal 5'-phosphate synthase glutaminase subunit PdxT [Micromonospora sp. AP08]TYB38575.1 pyridoxal 5'-phosphate synthase glutaminase subunit PdxT [Micromonospora sp. AP08]